MDKTDKTPKSPEGDFLVCAIVMMFASSRWRSC